MTCAYLDLASSASVVPIHNLIVVLCNSTTSRKAASACSLITDKVSTQVWPRCQSGSCWSICRSHLQMLGLEEVHRLAHSTCRRLVQQALMPRARRSACERPWGQQWRLSHVCLACSHPVSWCPSPPGLAKIMLISCKGFESGTFQPITSN